MQPESLLETAELLLAREGGSSKADLCRCVSTVYYALFRAISLDCAESFVGKGKEASKAWKQAFRALDHTLVASRCRDASVVCDMPNAIQDFAYLFSKMQYYRNLADYSHNHVFAKSTVLDYISDAKKYIKNYRRSNLLQRKEFLIHVMIKSQYHLDKGIPAKPAKAKAKKGSN